MATKKLEISEADAREALGLHADKWILEFDDEQLRMLQEIMAAEQTRREAVFEGLREQIDSIGT